jgi:hypothetical protein
MWPYWTLFGFFAIGALLTPPDYRWSKPMGVALLFGALVVIVMVGLRYDTGTDWGNYQRQWIAAQRLTLGDLITVHNGDAGFYTLMFLLRTVGLQYWTLNLICAAIFTWGLFAFARRLPNPWLAIAVAVPYLIIVIAMSATRQATALGFVFLALIAFSERRTRAFLGWTAAATLFHASAILTLPFAGLSFARTKFQAVLICAAIAILGWFTLGSPLAMYSVRYFNDTVQSSGLIYRVAMSSIAAVLYLVTIRPRIPLAPHERSLWRNYSLFALAAIVAAILYPTSTALDRTLIYLFPLQIFALSMIPYVSHRATPVLPIAAILLYLSAILFVFMHFGVNAESYIPYQIYWLSSGGP